MEPDPFRFDFRLVIRAGGNGYRVASRLEPERQRQIGMQVGERAESGDDDLRQYSNLALWGRLETCRPIVYRPVQAHRLHCMSLASVARGRLTIGRRLPTCPTTTSILAECAVDR